MDAHLEATICWFAREPLAAGRSFLLEHATGTVRAFVDLLRYRINVETLHRESSEQLQANDIGRVHLTTAVPLVSIPTIGTAAWAASCSSTRSRARRPAPASSCAAGGLAGQRAAANSVGTIAGREPQGRTTARGAIVWFTGLPASGKTTIADRVARRLSERGIDYEHLDGDEFRKTFSRDLGFTAADRTKNIERAAAIAGLLARHRVVVLATFVSPARAHRAIARAAAPDVLEVFVNAPLDVCMQRDPKGMYREARAGQRPLFTGVGDGYEAPESPDLELPGDRMSIDEAADAVMALLIDRGIVG